MAKKKNPAKKQRFVVLANKNVYGMAQFEVMATDEADAKARFENDEGRELSSIINGMELEIVEVEERARGSEKLKQPRYIAM